MSTSIHSCIMFPGTASRGKSQIVGGGGSQSLLKYETVLGWVNKNYKSVFPTRWGHFISHAGIKLVRYFFKANPSCLNPRLTRRWEKNGLSQHLAFCCYHHGEEQNGKSWPLPSFSTWLSVTEDATHGNSWPFPPVSSHCSRRIRRKEWRKLVSPTLKLLVFTTGEEKGMAKVGFSHP